VPNNSSATTETSEAVNAFATKVKPSYFPEVPTMAT